MLGRALSSSLLLFVLTALAPLAWAQPAESVEALEAELETGLEALAAATPADCGAACEALASLRRAAARICELDPGAPCEAARRKLEDAERRVREACPECALERQQEMPIPKKGGLSQGPEDEPDDDAALEAAPAPADAPQSERRGGCASCAVGQERGPDGALWLGLTALLLWTRRRRA